MRLGDRVRSGPDGVVHVVASAGRMRTACGTRMQLTEPWHVVNDRDADCMACVARGEPFDLEGAMAAAIGLPEEFLFGDDSKE